MSYCLSATIIKRGNKTTGTRATATHLRLCSTSMDSNAMIQAIAADYPHAVNADCDTAVLHPEEAAEIFAGYAAAIANGTWDGDSMTTEADIAEAIAMNQDGCAAIISLD